MYLRTSANKHHKPSRVTKVEDGDLETGDDAREPRLTADRWCATPQPVEVQPRHDWTTTYLSFRQLAAASTSEGPTESLRAAPRCCCLDTSLQLFDGLEDEYHLTHREERSGVLQIVSPPEPGGTIEPQASWLTRPGPGMISRAVETVSRRVGVESPPSLSPHKPRRKPTNSQRIGPTDLVKTGRCWARRVLSYSKCCFQDVAGRDGVLD